MVGVIPHAIAKPSAGGSGLEDRPIPVNVHVLLQADQTPACLIGLWSAPAKSDYMTGVDWSWKPLQGSTFLPPQGGAARFVTETARRIMRDGPFQGGIVLYGFVQGAETALVFLKALHWPPPPYGGPLATYADRLGQRFEHFGTWAMRPVETIDYGFLEAVAFQLLDNLRMRQHNQNLYVSDIKSPVAGSFQDIASDFDCTRLHYELAETVISYENRTCLGRELNYFYIGFLFKYFNFSWGTTYSTVIGWKQIKYMKKPSEIDVWATKFGYDSAPKIVAKYDSLNKGLRQYSRMLSPLVNRCSDQRCMQFVSWPSPTFPIGHAGGAAKRRNASPIV
jgi:hypothetical protein